MLLCWLRRRLNWVDLSFNKFILMPAVIPSIKSLRVLYLHGNNMTNLKEASLAAVAPDASGPRTHARCIARPHGRHPPRAVAARRVPRRSCPWQV